MLVSSFQRLFSNTLGRSSDACVDSLIIPRTGTTHDLLRDLFAQNLLFFVFARTKS